MNKKIAAIIAGSVAALGSAIVAAPVYAQAVLPVEITVKPAVFLRTYRDLKLVVSQQDLRGTGSVDQTATYDETAAGGPASLSTTDPATAGGTGLVTKQIPQLYQVWGVIPNRTRVSVSASQANLSSASSGGLNGGTANTATMSVSQETASPTVTNNSTSSTGLPYFTGGATLQFQFANAQNIAENTVYRGGQLRITVDNP